MIQQDTVVVTSILARRFSPEWTRARQPALRGLLGMALCSVTAITATEAGTLRGSVIDARNGAPLRADITITVLDMDARLRTDYARPPGSVGIQKVTVQTDPATGKFHISNLAEGTRLLLVQAAGYGFEYERVEVGGETTDLPAIELQPAATVRGFVLDEYGRPVADARVSVSYTHPLIQDMIRSTWVGDQLPTVRTDAEGKFEFFRLVKARTPYRVEARPDGYLPVLSQPSVAQPGDEVSGFVLQVSARGVRVVVRVTDSGDNPVQNAAVLFGDLGPFPSEVHLAPGHEQDRRRISRTDANGIVEFHAVPPGKRLLSVRAYDYATHRQSVDVETNQDLLQLKVTLFPK
ncbi:MAG: MSCRAMM family protein [Candidatus Acidiferrales bacterium]